MSLYKKLFKQTAIYGIATVIPRLISFILNPLYVEFLPKAEFGRISIFFSYLIFFNVVLTYGMETAFFRFYNKEEQKQKVVSTALLSLFITSILFMFIGFVLVSKVSSITELPSVYFIFIILILVLDTLSVIPFAKLRAEIQPKKYAFIKIANVVLNLGLNLFFLAVLPSIANSNSLWQTIYINNFEVGYIFAANLIASLFTFLILLPHYFKIKWQIDWALWKNMSGYGFPILIAGIAFAINEHFDKILLEWLGVNMQDIGAYAACYKIGMFMVFFRTAYSLGIEPFFFSNSQNKNAQQTYAQITKYFVIFGSFITLIIIVFADVLKLILVPNPTYWTAMNIVPLIVFANFFLGIYTNLSIWYKIIDKTKTGAYISILGAIVTLIINFLLIPKIGYIGSALATIFAYATMMMVSYKMGQKKYPIPYEKKIIFYILLSIILSGLSFYIPIFRQTYIFGTIGILIFAYFVFKNEKELLQKILRKN